MPIVVSPGALPQSLEALPHAAHGVLSVQRIGVYAAMQVIATAVRAKQWHTVYTTHVYAPVFS